MAPSENEFDTSGLVTEGLQVQFPVWAQSSAVESFLVWMCVIPVLGAYERQPMDVSLSKSNGKKKDYYKV